MHIRRRDPIQPMRPPQRVYLAQVHLTAAEREAWRAGAARARLPVSEWVRRAVEHHLDCRAVHREVTTG
jgi:hypothetical protein